MSVVVDDGTVGDVVKERSFGCCCWLAQGWLDRVAREISFLNEESGGLCDQ